ncbi:Retrovirus-related Pol Polyprotein from transposon 312, partial [Phytophthora megakarya]
VNKPQSSEYRQTNDYQPVNAMTEPIAGLIPILQHITEHVKNMAHFGLFDFIRGFWQLPLAETCWEVLSYMTDQTIYTPTRVPQGCSGAALYFQKTMENYFRALLYKHLLV